MHETRMMGKGNNMIINARQKFYKSGDFKSGFRLCTSKVFYEHPLTFAEKTVALISITTPSFVITIIYSIIGYDYFWVFLEFRGLGSQMYR